VRGEHYLTSRGDISHNLTAPEDHCKTPSPIS
jgi:hypothetical protein